MSARKGKLSSDQGWIASIWDWCIELEKATGLHVQISSRPAGRPGVCSVHVRALEVVDRRPAGIRCSVGGEWPNSDSIEYLPYVYQLLLRLDSKLAQDPLQQAE